MRDQMGHDQPAPDMQRRACRAARIEVGAKTPADNRRWAELYQNHPGRPFRLASGQGKSRDLLKGPRQASEPALGRDDRDATMRLGEAWHV